MNCADAQVRTGFAKNIGKQPQVEGLTQDSSCCFSEPAVSPLSNDFTRMCHSSTTFCFLFKKRTPVTAGEKERIELPEAAGVLFLKSGI